MDADLIRIDPAANVSPFYRLGLWPDLFGGVAVIREWGRRGQPGTVRLDSCETEAMAGTVVAKLRSAKQRRGYRPAR